MGSADVGDKVLFTNDLFYSRKFGEVEKVYLQGTVGECYEIKSKGDYYDIGINFIIAVIH